MGGREGRGLTKLTKEKISVTICNRARSRGRVIGEDHINTKVTGVQLTNEMKPGPMDHHGYKAGPELQIEAGSSS